MSLKERWCWWRDQIRVKKFLLQVMRRDSEAGIKDGHHLQNRSNADAVVLEIGSRKPLLDEGEYPDIDMRFLKDDSFAHKDGTPYPPR